MLHPPSCVTRIQWLYFAFILLCGSSKYNSVCSQTSPDPPEEVREPPEVSHQRLPAALEEQDQDQEAKKELPLDNNNEQPVVLSPLDKAGKQVKHLPDDDNNNNNNNNHEESPDNDAIENIADDDWSDRSTNDTNTEQNTLLEISAGDSTTSSSSSASMNPSVSTLSTSESVPFFTTDANEVVVVISDNHDTTMTGVVHLTRGTTSAAAAASKNIVEQSVVDIQYVSDAEGSTVWDFSKIPTSEEAAAANTLANKEPSEVTYGPSRIEEVQTLRTSESYTDRLEDVYELIVDDDDNDTTTSFTSVPTSSSLEPVEFDDQDDRDVIGSSDILPMLMTTNNPSPALSDLEQSAFLFNDSEQLSAFFDRPEQSAFFDHAEQSAFFEEADQSAFSDDADHGFFNGDIVASASSSFWPSSSEFDREMSAAIFSAEMISSSMIMKMMMMNDDDVMINASNSLAGSTILLLSSSSSSSASSQVLTGSSASHLIHPMMSPRLNDAVELASGRIHLDSSQSMTSSSPFASSSPPPPPPPFFRTVLVTTSHFTNASTVSSDTDDDDDGHRSTTTADQLQSLTTDRVRNNVSVSEQMTLMDDDDEVMQNRWRPNVFMAPSDEQADPTKSVSTKDEANPAVAPGGSNRSSSPPPDTDYKENKTVVVVAVVAAAAEQDEKPAATESAGTKQEVTSSSKQYVVTSSVVSSEPNSSSTVLIVSSPAPPSSAAAASVIAEDVVISRAFNASTEQDDVVSSDVLSSRQLTSISSISVTTSKIYIPIRPTKASDVTDRRTKYNRLPTDRNAGEKFEDSTYKPDQNLPTIRVPVAYLSVTMKCSWAYFCTQRLLFQKVFARELKNAVKMTVGENQVIFFNVQVCKHVAYLRNVSSPSGGTSSADSSNLAITVPLYVSDEWGIYSKSLTELLGALMVRKQYDTSPINNENNNITLSNVVLGVQLHRKEDQNGGLGQPNGDEGQADLGIIAAITISCIAAVCFVLLCILLICVKRRNGFKERKAGRCRPATADAYSLDSVSSVHSSFRRRKSRSSKRSYINQAFDNPQAPSRKLNLLGLANACADEEVLAEEFKIIPMQMAKYDELPAGVEEKNRYANIIPFPETRVILTPKTEGGSDYINANYVRGYRGEPRRYIACQAPLEDTVPDFWHMVWENQSKVIIMLTTLVEDGFNKCAPYFSESDTLDSHRLYGDFQVTTKKRDVRDDYTVSTLQIKNLEKNLMRNVMHYWYTSWPSHSVPSDHVAITKLLVETRPFTKSNSGPLVVHCSPGTGRTGTVLAIDVCMHEFEFTRMVDIPQWVHRLRQDRGGSVQTAEQYIFIYSVLSEYASRIINHSGRSSVRSVR